eukprot:TRINITY_DN1788_c3_g3_i1.p1 TRINITY_DN1788_c3_g3~~TRINITY_DN1788_c3_g3_i1.p1  ORF type:complete len:590 (+),score=168.81 TRINITY_DN1788_c3_g3_i1:48-1817(+)
MRTATRGACIAAACAAVGLLLSVLLPRSDEPDPAAVAEVAALVKQDLGGWPTELGGRSRERAAATERRAESEQMPPPDQPPPPLPLTPLPLPPPPPLATPAPPPKRRHYTLVFVRQTEEAPLGIRFRDTEVVSVDSGSPAGAAGLQAGDTLMAIAGKNVLSTMAATGEGAHEVVRGLLRGSPRRFLVVVGRVEGAPQPPPPPPLPLLRPRVRQTLPPTRAAQGISQCAACLQDPVGTLPIVMLAYRRSTLLQRSMDALRDAVRHAAGTRVRLLVSQDGSAFPDTTRTIEAMSDVTHLIHVRDPSKPPSSDYYAKQHSANNAAYFAIARHYGWVLGEVFSVPAYQRVVILEEDITVAQDFVAFMAALSPLFDEDPSLLCVSAWNDNGRRNLVSDASALYRSDFFPGLGWMMPRHLWDGQLRDTWPTGFWDDWLRDRPRRQGRACIRPEVSRTAVHCGDSSKTASHGKFCSEISQVRVSSDAVDWGKADLKAMLPAAYDGWLNRTVEGATVVDGPDQVTDERVEYLVWYNGVRGFAQQAKRFGLMTDEKAGVPRMAYRGCVTFRWKGPRVHLCDRRFPDFRQSFYLGGRMT